MIKKYARSVRMNERTLDHKDLITELQRGLDMMRAEGKTPNKILLSTRAWGELTGVYTHAAFPDEMEMTFKGVKVEVQILPIDQIALIMSEQKEITKVTDGDKRTIEEVIQRIVSDEYGQVVDCDYVGKITRCKDCKRNLDGWCAVWASGVWDDGYCSEVNKEDDD